MIEGGCLCGKIRYEYDGEINEIAMCHCSQCRAAQGGAFATNCPVASQALKFYGAENIKEFQSSDHKIRAFCSHCGSALYSARGDLPSVKRLRLGTVRTEFSCHRRYHIYVSSKAGWDEIHDEYPQYSDAKT